MLATLVDKPFSDPGWVFEPKYDGVRALAYVVGGTLRLITRKGNEVAFRYPELRPLPERVRGDVVLDGEIVSLDEGGRSDFQRLQQRLGLAREEDIAARAKEWPACYVAFDLLWHDGEDLRALPFRERRAHLDRAVRPRAPLLVAPQIDADGLRAFRDAEKQELEGVIAKDKEAAYVSGRQRVWLKVKTARRQEVVIAGWTDPRGSRPYLGALVVGLYGDGRKLHWVGNVGTGFMHESLKQLHALLRPLARATSPLVERVPVSERIHWVEPKLVCEVRFGEWTRDGRMRVPVFQGLRDDKRPEECRLEHAQPTRTVVRARPARRGAAR